MRTCLNGHHVTETWARVAWQEGEVGYCPRCEDIKKVGSAEQLAKDAEKCDNIPNGEEWYNSNE